MGKIPSIPWRERDYVRSYILPPTQAGTLVFTPSVWEPSLEGWRVVELVGWLVGCTCWLVGIYVTRRMFGDFWKRKTAV